MFVASLAAFDVVGDFTLLTLYSSFWRDANVHSPAMSTLEGGKSWKEYPGIMMLLIGLKEFVKLVVKDNLVSQRP